MSIRIICMDCGEQGEIDRLAPEILHACGSKNVDIWDGGAEQRRAAARRAGPEPVFASFMRESAQPPMPKPSADEDDDRPGYVGTDPVAGWDEYSGPGPHPNGLNPPVHTELHGRVPTRPVPGDAAQESNAYVYNKHNPPVPTTANMPDPLVAPHEYDLGQKVTTIPFLGSKGAEAGIVLQGARCPGCAAPDTYLVPDYREHAHWMCRRRCGSLVDLDKRPEVDPFFPGGARLGGESFSGKKKIFAAKKDGQLFRRMATIAQVNPGLSLSDVVLLARQSVIQYPEA